MMMNQLSESVNILVKTNWINKIHDHMLFTLYILIPVLLQFHSSYLCPFPSSSFNMRFWKSETMRGNPSLREIFGSQFSSSFALLISGFLLWGSSAVFGLNSIVALESIISLITYNNRMKPLLSVSIGKKKDDPVTNIQTESPHMEESNISLLFYG